MRQIFLGAFRRVDGQALRMASSIEVIGSDAQADNGSIITKQCTDLPAAAGRASQEGLCGSDACRRRLQQSQIRDVGGEKKLYRTEGWMGGSPIVFVTKAPDLNP
jgi:hypothetical protein